ncbi:aldo-keto reductase [Gymnopilus junonius]|uniref:Aldo-keto reductase n=1 Tax=Gymnopilus junonius TaxID=109634 RepID=A0A9P5TQJ0_GYMJU|nr:aldo-keto reductase [Gymnopilus junonius]
MAELKLQSKVQLRDGNAMPVIGFGTYELEGMRAYKGVLSALKAGYRLIDSAAWYENEREVGQAIVDFCQSTGTPRTDIFYTTKLKENNGYNRTKKAIQRSLDLCGLGYIDLYLIHGPLGGPPLRKESWRAICDFQKESGGLIKSVGISTFGIRHMKDIIDTGMPLPVVHQIDLHPFMTRTEIVKFSKEHGMVLEAWGPLARGYRFNHAVIVELSQKYDKKPAQILIRYNLQKGYVPIPKSASESRIIENLQVFDFYIADDDMEKLNQLNEDLVTDWDPTHCP